MATADDDEMFLLDGFEEEEGLYGVEGVDGGSSEGGNPLEERGNPLAFPQSDDEEISTDGMCQYMSVWHDMFVIGGLTLLITNC